TGLLRPCPEWTGPRERCRHLEPRDVRHQSILDGAGATGTATAPGPRLGRVHAQASPRRGAEQYALPHGSADAPGGGDPEEVRLSQGRAGGTVIRGYVTLEAVDTSPDIDAAIAFAPGVRDMGATGRLDASIT